MRYVARQDIDFYVERSYWSAQIKAGNHRARFFDIEVLGPDDIHMALSTPSNITVYGVSDNTGEIECEATLNNFIGLAAQIHFSMHPRNWGPKALTVADGCVQWLFTLARVSPTVALPLVDSIFGLTPVKNRLAVRFIQKIGFEAKGVLPKALYFKASNSYEDALITVRTREWVVAEKVVAAAKIQ
jgi:hypothetical protein